MNKTKYIVRVFDYENGCWITKHRTGLFEAAKSDRTNQRRKGLFAIVTYDGVVVNSDAKRKEEREGI
jgi:hypothetical protein